MTTKHYYAAYSPYGERTVFNDVNHGRIYRFDNREDRDNYVNYERSIESDINPQTFVISSDEARRCKKHCDMCTVIGRDAMGYRVYDESHGEIFYI